VGMMWLNTQRTVRIRRSGDLPGPSAHCRTGAFLLSSGKGAGTLGLLAISTSSNRPVPSSQ
jgi:hypothetical protein